MSNGHPKGVEYKRIRSDKILYRFGYFSKRKNMIWSDPFGNKRRKKPQVGLYILFSVDFLLRKKSSPQALKSKIHDGFFGIFVAQKFEHK